MEVSYKEQVMDDIIRQGELGFSRDEIVSNLKAKGVPEEEIRQMKGFIEKQSAVTVADARNTPTRSFVVTLLISLFSIVRGIVAFYKGHQGFGTLFVVFGTIFFLAGIAGLIAKAKVQSSGK